MLKNLKRFTSFVTVPSVLLKLSHCDDGKKNNNNIKWDSIKFEDIDISKNISKRVNIKSDSMSKDTDSDSKLSADLKAYITGDFEGHYDIPDTTRFTEWVVTEFNQHVVNSAVKQIEDSQPYVNQVAHDAVVEILQHQLSPERFKELLENLVSNDAILVPTRELVYWSLLLPVTRDNAFILSKRGVDYFLNDPASQPTVHRQVIGLMDWWFRHPLTTKDVLIPQIEWLPDPRSEYVPYFAKQLETFLASPDMKVELNASLYLLYLIVVQFRRNLSRKIFPKPFRKG